ncbi:MAG: AmmeMemoRadiSam system protein B [Deltaproteobacteria bacterium]|jgi:AmmeMemoRadiSam system protein B|nr:AmmeMemoRadiSam system protein B [Deltaproteobacteria bacterium]
MPEPLTREATLAGQWYPGSKKAIEAQLESWQGYIRSFKQPAGRMFAVIVPHAGWYFSGRLAAMALTMAVESFGGEGPALLVIMGGHLGSGAPLVAFGEDLWETPLGPVTLAPELNPELKSPDLQPKIWPGPTDDNTVEVQMPLAKLLAPKARVWALRVPPGPKSLALGAILARMEGADPGRALLVASTDLTHYGQAYGFAPAGPGPGGEEYRFQNDRSFIEPALTLDPVAMTLAGVRNKAACSAGAAAAVTEAARILGAQARLLDHYSSHDVRPGDVSVGYAAIGYEI